MVSDGEYIYYSQYGEPGLRKISADLSSEVLLADEDCTYICLVDDTIYYAVPDSGIWQMKRDGSERALLEATGDISGLCYDDGKLYYLYKGSIYCYDTANATADIAEQEEEYPAAAGEEGDPLFHSQRLMDDQYCSSLAVCDGQIYYTSSVDTTTTIYKMDAAGEKTEALVSGTGVDIYIEDGRIYYLEEDEAVDNNVNIRICSVDLSGKDRKLIFEEVNAAAYFAVCGNELYFTRSQTGGADDFEAAIFTAWTLPAERQRRCIRIMRSIILRPRAGIYGLTISATKRWRPAITGGKVDGKLCSEAQPTSPGDTAQRISWRVCRAIRPGESYLYLKTGDMSACYKLVRMDGTVEFEKLMEPAVKKPSASRAGGIRLRSPRATNGWETTRRSARRATTARRMCSNLPMAGAMRFRAARWGI